MTQLQDLPGDHSFLPSGIVAATGQLFPSTSYQDIPGASVTFTPDIACFALVTAIFDILVNVSGGSGSNVEAQLIGNLDVDGSAQIGEAELDFAALISAANTETLRATVSQVYRVSLTVAAHTLKLRGKRGNFFGATANFDYPRTRFLYQLVPQ